jgi:hypothetical protein
MHPRVLFLTMLLAAALSACSRSVPSHLPRTSPASAEAPAAAAAVVGRALREDPPLPGESTEGWSGLDAESAAATHAGHAHGGGHAH